MFKSADFDVAESTRSCLTCLRVRSGVSGSDSRGWLVFQGFGTRRICVGFHSVVVALLDSKY